MVVSSRAISTGNERFPTAMVVRIMSELLDALEYSHGHGVVHRDIKPANIILLADGSVKVADFGIARIESSTLTQAGTVLGSPSYMSPEQFTGQTVDGRSDLYSAAVVLYQLLTGEVPFTGSFQNLMHRVLNEEASPPSVLNVQVPRAFDAVLHRAMAKRPDERYQSAAEFKQAIVAASTATGVAAAGVDRDPHASQATLVEPPGGAGERSARSRAWHLGLPLAALCLAGIGVAAYFWIEPHATKKTTVATSGTPLPSATPLPAAVPTALETKASTTPPPSPAEALPPAGTTVISAVGLADPNDPKSANGTAAVERLWGDARRQLIAKAVALYVEPGSFNANYAVLHNKLLARSDEYISTVLEQVTPQLSKYGLMIGTMRATVKVHDVQKALNQISRDDRIEFIRNNGDPHIAVRIRASSAGEDAAGAPQRSAAAENLLKERIRSFGFVTVDEELAKPPADFLVDGEVRFKRLSAKWPRPD